jgi:hypothetical protein
VRKLVVLGVSAVAAGTIGLLNAGLASSDPVNSNQANVIGEPYYKAVKILKGMGMGTGFGGSVGSELPQAQCMVASQKMIDSGGKNKMLLNLDCTEEAAQQMADEGSLSPGGSSSGGAINTIRPPQIPIGSAGAPAAPAPAPAG